MATTATAIRDQDDDDDRDERGPGGGNKPQPPQRRDDAAAAGEGGFFTIRKKGQGYWTRMLTAACAAILIALTANFAYQTFAPTVGISARNPRMAIAGGIVVVGAVVAWWLMNKPDSVEFLIATDSEMKKVNWTSREDLIGSTKVVILFMFMISFFLFAIDVIFGYLFYFMTVLQFKPF